MLISFSSHVTCVTLIGLYKERLGRDAVRTADRNNTIKIFNVVYHPAGHITQPDTLTDIATPLFYHAITQ